MGKPSLVIVVIISSGPQTEAKDTSKEVPAVFVDFRNINLCLWEMIIFDLNYPSFIFLFWLFKNFLEIENTSLHFLHCRTVLHLCFSSQDSSLSYLHLTSSIVASIRRAFGQATQ